MQTVHWKNERCETGVKRSPRRAAWHRNGVIISHQSISEVVQLFYLRALDMYIFIYGEKEREVGGKRLQFPPRSSMNEVFMINLSLNSWDSCLTWWMIVIYRDFPNLRYLRRFSNSICWGNWLMEWWMEKQTIIKFLLQQTVLAAADKSSFLRSQSLHSYPTI